MPPLKSISCPASLPENVSPVALNANAPPDDVSRSGTADNGRHGSEAVQIGTGAVRERAALERSSAQLNRAGGGIGNGIRCRITSAAQYLPEYPMIRLSSGWFEV